MREWIGVHIRLAAEVLDHTFTGAVTDCGHAERTTLFLTAVESQLSERQVWPEFFQCAHCDTHFVVGKVSDSAVWWLSGPTWGWKFETEFATSSQPPGMKHFATLSNSLWSKDDRWAFSYSLRDSFLRVDINNSNIFFRLLSFRSP